ncbi:MAG: hypothetical protein HY038_06410 [Nitrospirae bacterium]|nr:hypothetical protein [Nitrospirota bacterium]
MVQTATTQTVMDIVLRSPGCDLEEVVLECRSLTWNQVFLEIDRLSREGYVILNLQRPGHYSIRPAQPSIRLS